jgi:transketolase
MSELKYNARAFSMLGQSGAVFGLAATNLRERYPIKILSSDMSVTAGLNRFKSSYPNDFYNVGIAEQNLIGISSGLSSEGFKTVAVAQACFITMRSFEQVRQMMGYMCHPVISVGISSGFALTFFGNTHYAIEDLSLMRSIPGMVVLSPADAGEAVKAFEAALKMSSPVYIRLTGGLNNPIVYRKDFDYVIGKSNVVFDGGDDVTVFATGSMVASSIEAAGILKEKELKVSVIDVHTIKPVDVKVIEERLNSRLLVSVEEHNVTGGLGTAIAEHLSLRGHSPSLLRLGVKDIFSNPGDYEYLLAQHRLTPELIAEDILNKYNEQYK